MTSTFPLLIDGVWRDGSEGAGNPVINPSTGQSIDEAELLLFCPFG